MRPEFLILRILTSLLTSLFFLTNGCVSEEGEFFQLLAKKIDRIDVESGFGAFEINNERSIAKIIDWLEQSREQNISFASYPAVEIKLALFSEKKLAFIIYANYPSYSDIPTIIKYKDTYFIAPKHPDIPEFEIFLKKTNPDNLIPKLKGRGQV